MTLCGGNVGDWDTACRTTLDKAKGDPDAHLTGGATHWGSLRDVQSNRFYARLTFTRKIGDHYFFAEGRAKAAKGAKA